MKCGIVMKSDLRDGFVLNPKVYLSPTADVDEDIERTERRLEQSARRLTELQKKRGKILAEFAPVVEIIHTDE